MTDWLPSSKCDDAANRIVGRDAHGDAVARHHLDAESAHPSAQLGEHFMARIALDPIQPPRVDGDDRALHVDKIVFAQQLILSRYEAMSVPYPVEWRNFKQNIDLSHSDRTFSSTWPASAA
jgi:hypothetical protein